MDSQKSQKTGHKMGGSPYRYFLDDPEGRGRGPGYYRWYYGQYFKRGEAS